MSQDKMSPKNYSVVVEEKEKEKSPLTPQGEDADKQSILSQSSQRQRPEPRAMSHATQNLSGDPDPATKIKFVRVPEEGNKSLVKVTRVGSETSVILDQQQLEELRTKVVAQGGSGFMTDSEVDELLTEYMADAACTFDQSANDATPFPAEVDSIDEESQPAPECKSESVKANQRTMAIPGIPPRIEPSPVKVVTQQPYCPTQAMEELTITRAITVYGHFQRGGNFRIAAMKYLTPAMLHVMKEQCSEEIAAFAKDYEANLPARTDTHTEFERAKQAAFDAKAAGVLNLAVDLTTNRRPQQVDQLADGMIGLFNDPKSRPFYCGLGHQLIDGSLNLIGLRTAIHASSGPSVKNPAALFTSKLKQIPQRRARRAPSAGTIGQFLRGQP